MRKKGREEYSNGEYSVVFQPKLHGWLLHRKKNGETIDSIFKSFKEDLDYYADEWLRRGDK